MAHSKKYKTMIMVAHSYFEAFKNRMIFNNNSTIEDFRKSEINDKVCIEIFDLVLKEFDYELSFQQMNNAISFLLTSNKL